ncbi:MAG: phosphotransferase enzyme family protein [Myxococcota bacterium]
MSESDSTGWYDAAAAAAAVPAEVLAAYSVLSSASEGLAVRSLSGGLLHQSLHVRAAAGDFVLQRVSDVFSPEIHQNIAAVTRHLSAHGVPTTELVPTVEGALFAELGTLGRWRMMKHLGGASFDRLESAAQAHSAGALVGRFHAAMRDFKGELRPMGIPYRDTPRYLASLRAAMKAHPGHRLASSMIPLAEQIFAAFDVLGAPAELNERVIHGDLKLSNLLFEGREAPARDRAFALVDLDTLMRAPLWVELGDAWRSWCNRTGEDGEGAGFDLPAFEASVKGFVAGYGERLSEAERASLETAPERITLELAARFVGDAFEETYWGWDPEQFATRGDHNAARAEGQWRLYEAMCATRPERSEILARVG